MISGDLFVRIADSVPIHSEQTEGCILQSVRACFLAFNLVPARKATDARLVVAGLRAHELLLAKLAVLVLLVVLLSAYETAAILPWVVPRHVLRVASGFALGGMAGACARADVSARGKRQRDPGNAREGES